MLSFRTDTENEISLVKKAALKNGAFDAIVCTHWADGGLGAADLADAVIKACETKNNFKFLYDVHKSIEEKISIVAKEMYGAGQVIYESKVKELIQTYNKQVFTKYDLNKELNLIKICFRDMTNCQCAWPRHHYH